jgi:hypothetical protein
MILVLCNNHTIAFASMKKQPSLSIQIFNKLFSSLKKSHVNKNTNNNNATTSDRPAYVLEKIRQYEEYKEFKKQQQQDNIVQKSNTGIEKEEKEEPYLYYFGVGSNMLRSKIENRGINGTTINILHIEPAVVYGHRLAFNMRGFPPYVLLLFCYCILKKK